MSWGYLGVVIWSAFFGLIYGLVYRRFLRSRQSDLTVMSFVVFLATSILAFRDGSLLTIFKQGLFFFAPIVGLLIAANLAGIGRLGRATGRRAADLGLAGQQQPVPLTPRERRFAKANTVTTRSSSLTLSARANTPRARRLARIEDG